MKILLGRVKERISKIPRERIYLLIGQMAFILMVTTSLFAVGRSTEPTRTWSIGKVRNERGAFDQCDATAENLYFSYIVSGKIFVDVYNNDGQFLYLVSVVDNRQNGGNSMRCHDERLYIRMKNGSVYVFQGQELVRTLSRQEAEELGFTYYWFEKRNVTLSMDDMYIYRVDGEGKPISQTPRDPEIRKHLYTANPDYTGNPVAAIVIIVVFISIVIASILLARSLEKNKPPHLGPH